MANEIELKFGTFELDDDSQIAIESIQQDEKKTINIHKIPKTDGSIAEDARRESLSISIKGTVSNSDYDALRTSIDNLHFALQNGLQKFTIDDDRYIMAQMQSFKKKWIALRTIASFDATFIAHFPFWLAETATVDDREPTSNVGYVITNDGNAPARCKIEIIAPAAGINDSVKIENQTNGQSFQYRGALSEDDVLIVDNRYTTDDFQVLNEGADDIENFEGDFIELEAGNNTIVFTGTADTTVKITYKDCWY